MNINARKTDKRFNMKSFLKTTIHTFVQDDNAPAISTEVPVRGAMGVPLLRSEPCSVENTISLLHSLV